MSEVAEALGKVALITGGGTGVGRATTLQLASRGFHTVVNYSRSRSDAESTAAAARELGRRAIPCECDVSNDAQVREMIRQCESEFGRLDVVVNNAGMTYFVDHTDLEAMSEEKWDRILDVNLKGPFFVSRAAIPLMRKNGGGRDRKRSLRSRCGWGGKFDCLRGVERGPDHDDQIAGPCLRSGHSR